MCNQISYQFPIPAITDKMIKDRFSQLDYRFTITYDHITDYSPDELKNLLSDLRAEVYFIENQTCLPNQLQDYYIDKLNENIRLLTKKAGLV